MIKLYHRSPNGHPARLTWLSGSFRVPRFAALTTGTAATFAPSALIATFSPSISLSHSLGQRSINGWEIHSPLVRHRGIEPQSYRQRRLSETVTGSLFVEYHRYKPAYFFFDVTKNLLFLVSASFSKLELYAEILTDSCRLR